MLIYFVSLAASWCILAAACSRFLVHDEVGAWMVVTVAWVLRVLIAGLGAKMAVKRLSKWQQCYDPFFTIFPLAGLLHEFVWVEHSRSGAIVTTVVLSWAVAWSLARDVNSWLAVRKRGA